MSLTEDDVRYVAQLANLNLSPEEIPQLVRNLGGILAHMDRLSEIKTDGVEPMTQILHDAPETATLREDLPREPLGSEAALANAPMSAPGYFKVPLVIER